MNRQQLYDAMGGRISTTSIGEYSGEIVILGKFGIVSWMDDYWDIWITGVHHERELSGKRVNSLCTAIKPLAKTLDTGLTREAIGVCTSNESAYRIALLLGARKRRQDSPETLTRLRGRMSDVREART